MLASQNARFWCSCIYCLVLITAARGQPQHTPDWWGTDDGRTFQEGYTFDGPADPPAATPDITPPWYPVGGSHVEHEGDGEPLDGVGGRDDLWGVRGGGKEATLTIYLWNIRSEAHEKHLWIQYDLYRYYGALSGPSVRVGPLNTPAGGYNVPRPAEDLGNGWWRHWAEWRIRPQPEWEKITFMFQTADSGGTVAIDNLFVGTHCERFDNDGDSSAYDFSVPGLPSEPLYVDIPADHLPPELSLFGDPMPQWIPVVEGHEGVLGLPPGMMGSAEVMLWADGSAAPDGQTRVCCQYDAFVGAAGLVDLGLDLPPGVAVESWQQYAEPMVDGWERRVVHLDLSPPPDWKVFHWLMAADPGGWPVVIDNVVVSQGDLWQDHWYAGFDDLAADTYMHDVDGWRGWDGNPGLGGFVSDLIWRSSARSLAVEESADFTQSFDGRDSGRWQFSVWQYIPSDFDSNGSDPMAGTYIVLLNTYAEGEPHADSDWSLQMNFDSNDGMLKVYYGNGLNTVNVPYVPEEWVEIQAVIDLDEDWTRIYYDDALVTEYSWTGGVLGGGGGAAHIAALNFVANGASPVYYDDLRLRPAVEPVYEPGDMNCDGVVNNFDIDPFVLALTAPALYQDLYPDCDLSLGDINADGLVNNFDIDPFVALLTGG